MSFRLQFYANNQNINASAAILFSAMVNSEITQIQEIFQRLNFRGVYFAK